MATKGPNQADDDLLTSDDPVQQVAKQIARLRSELANRDQEISDILAGHDELQRGYESLEQAHLELQQSDSRRQQDLDECKKDNIRLRSDNSALQSNWRNAGIQREKAKCEVDTLKEDLTLVKEEQRATKSENDELREEVVALQAKLSTARNERDEFKSNNESLEQAHSVLRETQLQLQKNCDNLQTKNVELRRDNATLRRKLSTAETERDEAQRDHEGLKRAHKELVRDRDSLTTDIGKLWTQLGAVQDKLWTAETDLQESRDSLKADINKLVEDAGAVKEKLLAAETELEDTRKKSSDTEEEHKASLAQLRADLKSSEERADQAKSERDVSTDACTALRTDMSKLREELNSLQAKLLEGDEARRQHALVKEEQIAILARLELSEQCADQATKDRKELADQLSTFMEGYAAITAQLQAALQRNQQLGSRVKRHEVATQTENQEARTQLKKNEQQAGRVLHKSVGRGTIVSPGLIGEESDIGRPADGPREPRFKAPPFVRFKHLGPLHNPEQLAALHKLADSRPNSVQCQILGPWQRRFTRVSYESNDPANNELQPEYSPSPGSGSESTLRSGANEGIEASSPAKSSTPAEVVEDEQRSPESEDVHFKRPRQRLIARKQQSCLHTPASPADESTQVIEMSEDSDRQARRQRILFKLPSQRMALNKSGCSLETPASPTESPLTRWHPPSKIPGAANSKTGFKVSKRMSESSSRNEHHCRKRPRSEDGSEERAGSAKSRRTGGRQ